MDELENRIYEFIKANGRASMADIEKQFPDIHVYPVVRAMWHGGHGVLTRKNFYYSVK